MVAKTLTLPLTTTTGNKDTDKNKTNSSTKLSSSTRMGAPEKSIAPAKVLGLTEYLCDKLPTADEIYLTDLLKQCLMSFDLYESDQEFQHRVNVLARLDYLAKNWIRQLAIEKNLPESLVDRVGGKLFTFGSYRLGVHTKGADIDTLLVAPRHVERDDFFNSFFEVLNQQPETQDLRAIEDAFVPVIKLYFGGIEMDILFARLGMQVVSDDTDLSDEIILKNLHISCVRSLNGTRVTDEILRLVPDRDAFRLTLHVIKLWAKRKAIYSNVLGFLGGVSWAMLVARVCQLYPRAAPATLVEKFFLVFNCWKWPTPVLLQKVSTNPHNINLPVWDPNTVVGDRLHFMPIITPALPEQNSSYNVSCSTLTIMKDALAEGFKTVQDIKRAELSRSPEERMKMLKAGLNGQSLSLWSKLFEEFQFFAKYKHFIVLITQSSTKSDHLEWYGLVESKIRILVQNLEKKSFVSLAHVYPKSFNNTPPSNNSSSNSQQQLEKNSTSPFSTQWFIGITFDQNALTTTNVDLTFEIQSFSQTVHHTAYKNSLLKPGMTLEARYVRRKDLPQYLSPDQLKDIRSSRRKNDSLSISNDAEASGRKRKSESSIEMENVEKKTKAMEVNDEESKLVRLKQELDKAELMKKEVLSSTTVSSNSSATTATEENVNNATTSQTLSDSTSSHAEVFTCEDVEKEDLKDIKSNDVENEDLLKQEGVQMKVEQESVCDLSSPLNVQHQRLLSEKAVAEIKSEVEKIKRISESEMGGESGMDVDAAIPTVIFPSKESLEQNDDVLDDEDSDDVIEIVRPPPNLDAPCPLQQQQQQPHPSSSSLSSHQSKRKFSQVELSSAPLSSTTTPLSTPGSTTTTNTSSSSSSLANSAVILHCNSIQPGNGTQGGVNLAATTPKLVDKKVIPGQPMAGTNIKLNFK